MFNHFLTDPYSYENIVYRLWHLNKIERQLFFIKVYTDLFSHNRVQCYIIVLVISHNFLVVQNNARSYICTLPCNLYAIILNKCLYYNNVNVAVDRLHLTYKDTNFSSIHIYDPVASFSHNLRSRYNPFSPPRSSQ